jgi:putative Mn2+ efflux pump MntP
MKTLRALFHLVRADFLERVRRYSFLVVLGLTIYAGYFAVPPLDANYAILCLGDPFHGYYRGVYNSAWIGAVVAWLASVLLSLFGFYLIKNAVERDQWTRVGHIIAATPISKFLYTLGKWFSNLAVLSAIVVLMILSAGVMQLIRGEDPRVDSWALVSTSLFVTLPATAMVAALAILFETIPGLRGGFGNIVYFIAALFFHRFDTSHGSSPVKRVRSSLLDRLRKWPRSAVPSVTSKANGFYSVSAHVHLTPVEAAAMSVRFGRTLLAELRLMLKGQRWWWYLVALGLIVAGLVTPLDAARQGILPFVWLWPLLIWSSMGTRESRYRTAQIVFSAAHPLRRQFPATWLAGLIVTVLAGSGVMARIVLTRYWAGLLGWTVGALFIPTLALALGCWSGNSKLFEVIYLVLWYLGPIEGMSAMDFMGISSESLTAGVPLCYLGLTVALLGLAAVGRWRQLGH